MNIKLIRQMKLDDRWVKTGSVITVDDELGKQLIAKKCAVLTIEEAALKSIALRQSGDLINSAIKEKSLESTDQSDADTDETETEETGTNKSESETEIKKSGTDTNESGITNDEQDDKKTVDISNFKVTETLEDPLITPGPYQIPGIDQTVIEILVNANYKTIESLKNVPLETLVALPKIGYQKAKKIVEYIKGM